ncbi:MAG: exo-alpha-sialidase [Desulfovibrio sp.]|nr:MAG: exo-alpha-sialidase [Desulfovibrio sp.]
MPSLNDLSQRHGVVDRRQGQYLCFPDICLTESGRLVAVYREMDRHFKATRRCMLACVSDDMGATWSEPLVLNDRGGHCPRLSVHGQVLRCIVDCPASLHESRDNGETWESVPAKGLTHGIPDRILRLDHTAGQGEDTGETWLSTAHLHRGTSAWPPIGQPPTEAMCFASQDQGRTWKPLSVMSLVPCLTLCEGSMVQLGNGHILALFRENSHVFEPMYALTSRDFGATWSEPIPTTLLGHRPCLGLTRDGRLLATFRNVGPDHGTAAWLGTVEELLNPDQEYWVHGLTPLYRDDNSGSPRLTPEGLLLDSTGQDSPGPDCAVFYCLRPLTDPARAKAELTLRMQCLEGEAESCGLRFGVWWRIGPDRIRPEIKGARSLKLPQGQVNELRLSYDQGVLTLRVNGRKKRDYTLDPARVERRAIILGSLSRTQKNRGKSLWQEITLHIHEPGLGREYQYIWNAAHGLPDARARAGILELRNDRQAIGADFGYSGWVETGPGEFFCVYHHGAGHEPDYRPGYSSHVAWTRFVAGDFAL